MQVYNCEGHSNYVNHTTRMGTPTMTEIGVAVEGDRYLGILAAFVAQCYTCRSQPLNYINYIKC